MISNYFVNKYVLEATTEVFHKINVYHTRTLWSNQAFFVNMISCVESWISGITTIVLDITQYTVSPLNSLVSCNYYWLTSPVHLPIPWLSDHKHWLWFHQSPIVRMTTECCQMTGIVIMTASSRRHWLPEMRQLLSYKTLRHPGFRYSVAA